MGAMKRQSIAKAVVRAPLLCAVLIAALAASTHPAPAQTPSPSAEPSPGPASGSVEGRVYADVNRNEVFDNGDVPLRFPISLDGYYTQSSETGTYQVQLVSPGTHSVSINVPVPAACVAGAYTWAGEHAPGGCYGAPRFRDDPQTVIVAAGQTVVIDFLGVPFKGVVGWVWKNGVASGENSALAMTVGGEPCWPARLDQHTSPGGALVTKFETQIDSFVNPNCIGGNISISVDGQQSEFSMPWSDFWSSRLYPESETFGNPFAQTMIPLFWGAWGNAYSKQQPDPLAGSDLADLTPDGTFVRAFTGSTLCGQARTKTLYSGTTPFANVFGLSGCLNSGLPAICIGSVVATGLAQIAPDPPPAAGQIARFDLLPTAEPCPLGPAGLPSTGGLP